MTPTQAATALLTLKDLKSYFLDGCKKPDELQVGVEWEKLAIYKESGRAIGYYGNRGIEAIFGELIRKFGWKPVHSHERTIALRKNGSSITLEPGGQIELSGKKAYALDDNASELFTHLDELKEVSEPLGIAWLGLGLQPFSRLDEIEWVPKERYRIMRETFKSRGELTYRMMKQTASIQASLDYLDEKDAIEKLRLAFALYPVLTGIFANSPVSEGRISGRLSERAHIWSKTAPERTGILDKVFEPGFGFDDYIEYALDVPLLFITRGDEWHDGRGLTFRDYMREGLDGKTPTLEDWQLHLTTIFTEARLKQYVEIRSADCQRRQLGLSVPAFLKGLFYSENGRKTAWERLQGYSPQERRLLAAEAAQKGFEARFGKAKLLDLARELTALSEKGLEELARKNPLLKNDAAYLAPLKKMLDEGMTSAERITACFNSASTEKDKIEKILCCAAI